MARQLEWQKLASPGSGAWESESKAPSGLVPGEPHVLACRRPLCHRLHGVAGEHSRESPQEGARPGRPGPGPHVPIRLTHLCKGLAPVTRGGSGPPRGVGGDTIRRTTVVNMERSLCCEFLMTFHCEHNKTDRSGDGGRGRVPGRRRVCGGHWVSGQRESPGWSAACRWTLRVSRLPRNV